MQRKIIYLINPISGIAEKGDYINLIKEKTSEQNIPFEIIHTKADGNYFFLREKIDSENITDVIVCGGDGSVNNVARSLLDMDVNIGIIPMGSGNGLAYAAKIPKNIQKALQIIFQGKSSYIDSFFINEQFSCMLCGLGFDAQVAHDFAKQPRRGLWTYINQTIKNFICAKAYHFDITVRGKCFETNAYFISIANSNQFGNRFTIAPKASLNDGLLDLVVVKKMSKIKMFLAIIKQITRGKINEHDDVTFLKRDILYFQSDKFIIRNLSSAPLHIDGDPAETAKRFSIEIIHEAFKLIQP